MSRIITTVGLLCAAVCLSPVAGYAADMPQVYRAPPQRVQQNYVPQNRWNGFYAGLNAGGAWGGADGALVGVQAGYNWQFDQLVLGARTDFSYFSGKASASASEFGVTATETAKAPWMGTAVGLVGYSPEWAPNWLVYGVGGVAYTRVNYNLGLSGAFVASDHQSSFKTGPYAGLGLGYALSRNWNATVEWGHAWFPGDTITYTIGPASIPVIHPSSHLDMVKASLNYRF